MASQSYQENMTEIQRDYDNVLTQYNRQAKGPGKAEILAEFVLTMNKAISSMVGENSKKDDKVSSVDRIKMDQNAQMVKIKEEEIKTLKRQL